MKVKNKDIVTFLNGIEKLKDRRFPVKVSYAINKNIRAVSGAAEAYNKTLDEIKERYEHKEIPEGDRGENSQIAEEKKKEFVKELNELREIETDVELIVITCADLEACDSDKFSALSIEDMETLDIMME